MNLKGLVGLIKTKEQSYLNWSSFNWSDTDSQNPEIDLLMYDCYSL